MSADNERKQEWLLWLGCAAGIALMSVGILGGDASGDEPDDLDVTAIDDGASATVVGDGLSDEDVVATINGNAIPADRYYGAIAEMAIQDRGPELTVEQRESMLNDLITDELLVERGLELRLVRHIGAARRALTTAVIESVLAPIDAQLPSDDDLRAFYEEQVDQFEARYSYHVEAVFIRGHTADDLERARQAQASLAGGEPALAVETQFGDPSPIRLPDGPTPAGTLRNYIGPTATRTAAELEPGGVSDPIRVANGYRIIQLIDRVVDARPAFEDVRDSVLLLWRRQQEEQALADTVERLRNDADVVVNRAILEREDLVPDVYLERARALRATVE